MSPRPRILYVDDDLDQLRLFRLSQHGEFEVEVASSGEQAVQVISSSPSFAVVVSDMRMPRMNGAQLLGLVREISPNTVRVLLTGDADLNSAMEAVNEGYVFRYLIKPCSREHMREVLKAAVNEHVEQQARDGLERKLQRAIPADGPDESALTDPRPGEVVAGRYRVQEMIGSGSSGSIYHCHDQVLMQEVALKLFPANLSDGRQERIRREIVLSRKLVHPRIIHAYDIGAHHGRPFITMELLVGHDLSSEIRGQGLDVTRALRLLTEACEGVAHAHRMGVLHRDIKPENLFVAADDHLRIMDFGLAKHTATPQVTNPRAVAGTIHYMSPEQFDSFADVDTSTDIYALGAVAYELLTGRAPFEYEGFAEMRNAHQNEPPVPPSQRRPGLPQALDTVVLRALAKTPSERYPDAEAFAAALQVATEQDAPTAKATGAQVADFDVTSEAKAAGHR